MSMTNPVKSLNDVYGTHGHTIVGAYNARLKEAGVTLDQMSTILGEARWPRNLAEISYVDSQMITVLGPGEQTIDGPGGNTPLVPTN